MDRISFFKLSTLPDPFGVVLLVFSFILMLVPYFSGTDFGLFKVPIVNDSTKKVLKIIGPVLFLCIILLFVPIVPNTKTEDSGKASPPSVPSSSLELTSSPVTPNGLFANEPLASLRDPKRDLWQRPAQVIALLKLEKDMTVADIGAGTGYFLPFLSMAVGKGGTVHALDVQPDAIRKLKKETAGTNIQARIVDQNNPELPPREVHRILIVNTWHHFSHPKEYARALAKALRTDGFALVIQYTKDTNEGTLESRSVAPQKVIKDLIEGGRFNATLADHASLPEQFVVVARCQGSCGN